MMMERQDLAVTFASLNDPVCDERSSTGSLRGEATVNELAALFPISLQAVSKHIKVLETAGVVSRRTTSAEAHALLLTISSRRAGAEPSR